MRLTLTLTLTAALFPTPAVNAADPAWADRGGTTKERLARRWAFEKKGEWTRTESESLYLNARLTALGSDKALAELADAAKAFPNEPDVLYFRAKAYLMAGQGDKAVAEFQTLMKLTPRHEFDRTARGAALNAAADLVLAGAPKNDPTALTTARQLWTAALAEVNEAVRLNPKYATAYNDRSSLYVALGKNDLALRDMDKAVELARDNPLVYLGRAYVRGNARDDAGKLADLTTAIGLAPDWPAPRRVRGIQYFDAGEFRKAVADLDVAIRLMPRAADLYYFRGTSHANLVDLPAAVRDLSTAIELSPNDPAAYEVRAAVYRDQGQAAKADADTRRAAELRHPAAPAAPTGMGPR